MGIALWALEVWEASLVLLALVGVPLGALVYLVLTWLLGIEQLNLQPDDPGGPGLRMSWSSADYRLWAR